MNDSETIPDSQYRRSALKCSNTSLHGSRGMSHSALRPSTFPARVRHRSRGLEQLERELSLVPTAPRRPAGNSAGSNGVARKSSPSPIRGRCLSPSSRGRWPGSRESFFRASGDEPRAAAVCRALPRAPAGSFAPQPAAFLQALQQQRPSHARRALEYLFLSQCSSCSKSCLTELVCCCAPRIHCRGIVRFR